MGFKIYTKTGDDGTTGLVGGNRVKKSSLRLDAYGTIDELNAHMGMLVAKLQQEEIQSILLEIQNKLFVIGSKLASDEKGKQITNSLDCSGKDIEKLEKAIDSFEEELPPLQHFILPGGSEQVSQCHITRTVCRRAERMTVQLAEVTEVESIIIQYLNRLSDFLFVLSRKVAKDQGVREISWMHD